MSATVVPSVPPLLLTAREAAQALRVSERTLFSLTKAGKVRCIRPTAWSVRYAVADLEKFIEQQRVAQGGQA